MSKNYVNDIVDFILHDKPYQGLVVEEMDGYATIKVQYGDKHNTLITVPVSDILEHDEYEKYEIPDQRYCWYDME